MEITCEEAEVAAYNRSKLRRCRPMHPIGCGSSIWMQVESRLRSRSLSKSGVFITFTHIFEKNNCKNLLRLCRKRFPGAL